jgi:hypothetical protein
MKRGLTTATLTLLLTMFAGAQTTTTPAPIAVGSADTAAAAGAKSTRGHVFTANTPAGAAYKEQLALVGPPSVPFPPGGNRWPGDLSYQGGNFVGQAQFHAVYILNSPTVGAPGCTPATLTACWASPETFLANLGKSDFAHVSDQYVQRSDNNRYTVGGNAEVYFTPYLPHILTDADMQAVVHLVVSALGYQNGYQGIFHIFLPPGTDECFDSTYTTCYSPDIPKSFAFCGYHNSVNFLDIGETLYSVEPSENVAGCNVPPGSPQGQLADSTYNVLSHETFETITDPDGNAWWNTAGLGLRGEEIGDECAFVVYPTTGGVFFNPSVFRINGVRYAVPNPIG